MAITLDFPAAVKNHSSTQWDEMKRDFGMFTSSDVATLMGARAMNKSKQKLIAVNSSGTTLFPGFQFDNTGALNTTSARVSERAKSFRIEPENLAHWMCERSEILDGFRPVDLLAHEDIVLAAFDRRFPQFSWN